MKMIEVEDCNTCPKAKYYLGAKVYYCMAEERKIATLDSDYCPIPNWCPLVEIDNYCPSCGAKIIWTE